MMHDDSPGPNLYLQLGNPSVRRSIPEPRLEDRISTIILAETRGIGLRPMTVVSKIKNI